MVGNEKFRAFYGTDSYDYLNRCRELALERFGNSTSDEEKENILKIYTISPLKLLDEKVTQQVSENNLLIFIPFEGNGELFKIRPSRYSTYSPLISMSKNQEIILTIENIGSKDTANIKTKFNNELDSLKSYVNDLKNDIENHNTLLKNSLNSRLALNKGKSKSIEEKIKDLGIPERK